MSLFPVVPALPTLLPLDFPNDTHVSPAPPGLLDPEAGVLEDASRPLVLYAIHPAGDIRLTKAPSQRVYITFR